MSIFSKGSKWTEEDLEELDQKFDALCRFLNVEFVFEKVSDGSDSADKHRVFCRKKEGNAPQHRHFPIEKMIAMIRRHEIRMPQNNAFMGMDFGKGGDKGIQFLFEVDHLGNLKMIDEDNRKMS